MRVLNIISFHLLYMFVCSFDMSCDYWNNTCSVRQLNCTKSGQIVDSVNNLITPITDIIYFIVQNQTCHYIPEKIADFMPKLVSITVMNSGLRTISKSDLAPFSELTTLVLSGNQLEYIDGDLFSQNSKIVGLSLEDTKLQIINGPILAPLNQMFFIKIDLECFKGLCYSFGGNCMPKIAKQFTKNCEFDSKYPGFRKYFEELKDTTRSCKTFKKKLPQIYGSTN